mmetsp:Transcript_79003/g.226463  ORF Transcript_79003/g.226463 Transcript_79003/m.226463 type:complete len:313 (-) Transcript_79003:1493-2431(-)
MEPIPRAGGLQRGRQLLSCVLLPGLSLGRLRHLRLRGLQRPLCKGTLRAIAPRSGVVHDGAAPPGVVHHGAAMTYGRGAGRAPAVGLRRHALRGLVPLVGRLGLVLGPVNARGGHQLFYALDAVRQLPDNSGDGGNFFVELLLGVLLNKLVHPAEKHVDRISDGGHFVPHLLSLGLAGTRPGRPMLLQALGGGSQGLLVALVCRLQSLMLLLEALQGGAQLPRAAFMVLMSGMQSLLMPLQALQGSGQLPTIAFVLLVRRPQIILMPFQVLQSGGKLPALTLQVLQLLLQTLHRGLQGRTGTLGGSFALLSS